MKVDNLFANKIVYHLKLLFIISLVFFAAKSFSLEVFYYHSDIADSPLIITNLHGNIESEYEYRPFGERENSLGDDAQEKISFTAGIHDDSGLLYLNRRFYHPKIRRFLSLDPIGVNIENPTSFNRYSYSANDPYGKHDPSGASSKNLIVKWNSLARLAAMKQVKIINKKLAGKVHPKTKVPFDADGFPIFDKWAKRTVEINMTGNRKLDNKLANIKAKLSETPDGMVWHHDARTGKMQLLPMDIHNKTGHTGSVAILKKAAAILAAAQAGIAEASTTDYVKFGLEMINPFDILFPESVPGSGSICCGEGAIFQTEEEMNLFNQELNNITNEQSGSK